MTKEEALSWARGERVNDELNQLRSFAEWERTHNPHPEGRQHVAEWALREIERLRAAKAQPVQEPVQRNEIERLRAEREACAIYLKEGETPAQRIERDHRDSLALMRLLAQEKRKTEALLEALLALLRDPNGCAFCDAGRLRKSALTGEPCEHDPRCGFVLASAAIKKAEGEKT